MTAESVGWSTNRLTLGKLSGRNAFKTKLADWASSWKAKRR